jgi:large subunit ribosomal protein L29
MKATEYRKLTDEELQKELDGLRKNLFQIRTKQVTDVVENSASIGKTRRDIARVMTVLTERQKKTAAAKPKAAPAPKAEPKKKAESVKSSPDKPAKS